ncbi:CorA family divalent cation transporter [Dasania marina]|uniref:CorA family divalent cation transporter n=1 Tax=Dasania marina TaxID=471499 RepID=UPI0030DBFA90|tara:strand:- start:58048 stop:59016 length:969 start_codon:yes stop_codon:yes gene_type:complete
MFALKFENNTSTVLDNHDLPQQDQPDVFYWYHFDGDLEDARQWLKDQLKTDSHSLNALCDELTRPRVFVNDSDQLLLTLRSIDYKDENEAEFPSLRVWLSQNVLITLARVTVPAVAVLSEKIQLPDKYAKTPSYLIWRLVDLISDHISAYIVDLDENISNIEEEWELNQRMDSQTLHNIRLNISHVGRFLLAQLEALQKLDHEVANINSSQHDKSLYHVRWRETINTLRRDIELHSSIRERISLLRDAQQQRNHETSNRTILLLSVVATFFLPLTFIASLLGMNVAGIPAYDHPMAFAVVCIIMAFIALIQWLLFKHWRWLK